MKEIRPFEVAIRIELAPIRPDVDQETTVQNRGAMIRLAKELGRHAANPRVEAIRIKFEGTGIAIAIATRK